MILSGIIHYRSDLEFLAKPVGALPRVAVSFGRRSGPGSAGTASSVWSSGGGGPRAPTAEDGSNRSTETMTRRLTMAQAVIQFLKVQHVSRDGNENPFFAGCFGIFGHGNVAGGGHAPPPKPEFSTELCSTHAASGR